MGQLLKMANERNGSLLAEAMLISLENRFHEAPLFVFPVDGNTENSAEIIKAIERIHRTMTRGRVSYVDTLDNYQESSNGYTQGRYNMMTDLIEITTKTPLHAVSVNHMASTLVHEWTHAHNPRKPSGRLSLAERVYWNDMGGMIREEAATFLACSVLSSLMGIHTFDYFRWFLAFELTKLNRHPNAPVPTENFPKLAESLMKDATSRQEQMIDKLISFGYSHLFMPVDSSAREGQIQSVISRMPELGEFEVAHNDPGFRHLFSRYKE